MPTPLQGANHTSPNTAAVPAGFGETPETEDGPLGTLQTNLRSLTYTLLELSVCAQDVQPPRPEDGPHGRVALKISEIITQLTKLDAMREALKSRIPMQVLRDVDANRNPHLVTKERIERAAAENQFIKGKLAAIESYRDLLGSALRDNFEELGPMLDTPNSGDPRSV